MTRNEQTFQGGFAMLHVYAAALALVAAGMHFAAAAHHARRFRRSTRNRRRVLPDILARYEDF